jgi:AmiR/NasT family two-component response regulator
VGPQPAEIHQATGMVMAQLEISAESALATLHAFAYANAQLIADIASRSSAEDYVTR